MRFSRTALVAAALLVATRATAQDVPSPYEYRETTKSLHGYAGYLWTDRNLSINDSTSVGLGPSSAPALGVRFQVRATGPLSVELGIGVSPSERELFSPVFSADSTVVEGESLGTTVASTIVMLDVGMRFHVTGARTWHGLAPFVFGMGGIAADADGTFAEEDGLQPNQLFRFGPSFAVGGGLGVDWFPRTNLSVRIEGVSRMWRMKAPGGFIPRGSVVESQWQRAAGVSVGAALHF